MADNTLPTIDTEAAIDRVTAMMAIPGKSGEEEAITSWIIEQLRSAGLDESHWQFDTANLRSPLGGKTGNLIVTLPGTLDAPRRLLMAHVDTVPLCQGCEPVREGDLISSANKSTALGGDDRAGACVILTAILEILRQDLPHPPLTVLFAVQEEVGLLGCRHIDKELLQSPQLCFNFDGALPEMVIIGATGDIAMDITVRGIASHAGARPEDGVSAAVIAGLAIASLQNDGWHGLIEKDGKSGTSNVGVLQGGDATNVVLPELKLRAEARSHDPVFRQQIASAYEAAFQTACDSMTNVDGQRGSVEFQAELKYEAFALDESEPVVDVARRTVQTWGLEPQTRIVNGGLDANWMAVHGFPTVTFGCGQMGIHTVAEQLHVPQFLQACNVGLSLACGLPD